MSDEPLYEPPDYSRDDYIKSLEAQLAAAQALLQKYGNHRSSCVIHAPREAGADPVCDCGWAEVRKR